MIGIFGCGEVATAKLVDVLKEHRTSIFSLAFSPDGKTLTSDGGDQTVHLWITHTSELLHRFQGNPKAVWTLALSPNKRFG